MDNYINDWEIFRNAVIAFWSGANPYLTGTDQLRFYNPVWTLVLLTPFSWLPAGYDIIALTVCAYVVMFFVFLKLKMKPWKMFFFLTSIWLLGCVNGGNIDWLPWIGLLIPNPSLSLLFFIIKPQETIGAIIIILYINCHDELMKKEWKTVFIKTTKAVLPVFILLIIQTLIYGLPNTSVTNASWNVSMFPYSIPIGLIALYYGLKKRNVRFGAFSSPFLAPYTSYTSYVSTSIAFPFISWIVGWVFAIPEMIKLIR